MTLTEAVKTKTNLNTWVTLFTSILTIVATLSGFTMLYGAERAENRMRHDYSERRFAMLESQVSAHQQVIQNIQIAQSRMEIQTVSLANRLSEVNTELRRIYEQLRQIELRGNFNE